MPPESVVVCLDNSSWSINGDYGTSRLSSQAEAVKSYFNLLKKSNAENIFGLVDMVNQHLVCSFNNDADLVIDRVKSLECDGEVNISRALRVSQLVLKNKPDTKYRSQILLFLHSPFKFTEEEANFIFENFKNSKIALNIVAFSEHVVENTQILVDLTDRLNDHFSKSPETNELHCHFLFAEVGTSLKTSLLNSPMCFQLNGGSSAVGGNANAGNSNFGGYGYENDGDENFDDLDEELQMALKLSKAEFERQQILDNNSTAQGDNETADNKTNNGDEEKFPNSSYDLDVAGMDDEQQLALALYLSMQNSEAKKDQQDDSQSKDTDKDNDKDTPK